MLINSNIRCGNREYNEMYVSNPEVMGVYAYDAEDKKINDVMQFVKKQEDFIRNYALEKDIPFVVINGPEGLELKDDGALCNVAPTVLQLMGIEQPKEMDCESLIK